MLELTPFVIGAVFFAGVLMFLAPCTLPLLPAYLGYISGVAYDALHKGASSHVRRRVFQQALLFVVGFTVVFMVLGLLASFAGAVLAPVRQALTVIGGVLIIVFGLYMIGVIRIAFLSRARRLHLPRALTPGASMSTLLLGAAFALGWTPCIGPLLGAVLFYASTTETLLLGAGLLLVFSLGFAIPFLLLALFLGQATNVVERIAPYLRGVSVVGGIVLVLFGIMLVFGHTPLTDWFFSIFNGLDYEEALLKYL